MELLQALSITVLFMLIFVRVQLEQVKARRAARAKAVKTVYVPMQMVKIAEKAPIARKERQTSNVNTLAYYEQYIQSKYNPLYELLSQTA